MRLIVEIPWGRLRGRKVVLDPGAILRVGRGDRRALSGVANASETRKDLVVEHDRQMSLRHFELSWDGERCHLTAITAAADTLLNGEAVRGGDVSHGDWLRAGETIFSVYIEEHTPPRRGSGAGMTPARESALRELASVEGLHAVLDAARDDRIVQLLKESLEEYQSLYEGLKGDALADKAPYLVALPAGSRLLRRLVEEGWSPACTTTL